MKMVQYISLTSHLAPLSINLLRAGRMPNPYSPQENLVFVEQANSCLVEQAGKPVHENGTKSQILPSLKDILHHFFIYTRRRLIQFGNLPGV